jgi:hypothetical protein
LALDERISPFSKRAGASRLLPAQFTIHDAPQEWNLPLEAAIISPGARHCFNLLESRQGKAEDMSEDRRISNGKKARPDGAWLRSRACFCLSGF